MDLKKDKYLLLLLTLSHTLWFVAAVFIWQKLHSYEVTGCIQTAAALKNGLYYSGNAQLPLTGHFMPLLPPLYSLPMVLCPALLLAGFLLFLFSKPYNISLRIAVAVFVFYFALITGPVTHARYFLPILMVASACSWVSYVALWQNRKLKICKNNVAIQ